MPKMPSMSSKELVRLLEKGGAVFVRQGSTAPSNPAISLDNITETASQVLTVTISVSDDTGITGYYLSESEAAPTAISDGWISIQTTTSYNSNVSFTLSSGNGNKTIYVWFMDGAGNISQSSSAAITLNQTDTTAPSSPSVSINNGDTLTTSTAVTLTLSATDNVGVTAYYVSENSAVPSANASGWKSVASATSYSAVVPFTLSSGSIGSSIKTVYAWFRDSAGNISVRVSDTITLTISDTTAPSSPSVLINNGDASTTSTAVTLTLSATDNVGVIGYYASETSTTPSASASGWTSVTSTTSYSATVSFTLSGGSVGDNTKTVYVWFRNSAGNISASASDSITLTISDTTAPTNPSVSIDSGASSTTSTSVTLTLSATDDAGVTAYYASETSTTPSASASGWTSVTSTTSYSASVSFTLSSGSVGDNTKTAYVWFKDSAGNVSASLSDSITLGSAPSAPTGVTATAGNGQVSISWSSVSGATSYNIYWSTSSGVTKTTGTKITGVTSPYTHTGLTNGTTYYYVGTQVNSYGESSESNQVSGTPWDSTAGLIGYWKMDETSGSTVTDSSGSGIHGTAVGTTIVTGKFGNGRQGGSTNDYINLGNTLPWISNTVGTITIWFKANDVTTRQAFFGTSHTANVGCGSRLMFEIWGGKLNGEIGYASPCNGMHWDASTTLTTGQWYFAAFQYDGNSYRMFLNGAEQTLTPNEGGTTGNSSWFNATNDGYQQVGIILARTYQGTYINGPFNGIIDEVRIYNRALSASKISTLYSSQP